MTGMSSRYDILFEPVRIGPVTAPNRFFQVPHCTALGHTHPQAEARNRAIKAEGGWGVICTQEVEIHPRSEVSPFAEGRLWDERDIPAMQLMTEAVHAHGALAGIELTYSGHHAANFYSRVPPLGSTSTPVHGYAPVQARAMTLADIHDVRQWHVNAARNARAAGFDIIYVYAGHDMSVLQHFLTRKWNRRSDDYGGSLTNRARLLKETLTDVKEAVGDTCAVALRLAVDEPWGAEGIEAHLEGRDIVSMLAEIPDLWDVNISDWSRDSATARFQPDQGYQEEYTAFVKTLTSKPVVGVGRFTSPDTMVSQITRGVLDLIGAARPSIADPFLPNKIRQGAFDQIRECIGCNICTASDNIIAPIRCTQNPTMGEEWKRGWHPEKIAPAVTPGESALVVGAGPAGLECALQLGLRGYNVTLAERSTELGGRSLAESRLTGLASYSRVKDYRLGRLSTLANVQIYPDNDMTAADVLSLEIPNVYIATGATWCLDGSGRQHTFGLPALSQSLEAANIGQLTPESIMRGEPCSGRVLIYDDDHYYMGGVLAEHLTAQGCDVTLVTPAARVSSWAENTLELDHIEQRLFSLGVQVIPNHQFSEVNALTRGSKTIAVEHVVTGQVTAVATDTVCIVTSRVPNTALYEALAQSDHSLSTLKLIGDCEAPSTMAAAVYAGHLAARSLECEAEAEAGLFQRELISLASTATSGNAE